MAIVPPQLPPELLATCQDDNGPMLLIIALSFLAVAFIAVFRLYFRYTLRNGLNADDWTMLASLVCPPSPLSQSKPSD